MIKVFCPSVGRAVWANPCKSRQNQSEYRCTACGCIGHAIAHYDIAADVADGVHPGTRQLAESMKTPKRKRK
jgi:hypothetical protein